MYKKEIEKTINELINSKESGYQWMANVRKLLDQLLELDEEIKVVIE